MFAEQAVSSDPLADLARSQLSTVSLTATTHPLPNAATSVKECTMPPMLVAWMPSPESRVMSRWRIHQAP